MLQQGIELLERLAPSVQIRHLLGFAVKVQRAHCVQDIQCKLELLSLDRDGALRVTSFRALGKLVSSLLR